MRSAKHQRIQLSKKFIFQFQIVLQEQRMLAFCSYFKGSNFGIDCSPKAHNWNPDWVYLPFQTINSMVSNEYIFEDIFLVFFKKAWQPSTGKQEPKG